jgi:hypothetical protein
LSIESRPIVSSHGLEGSRRHTLLFGDLVHFSRGELSELVLGFLVLLASAKESAEVEGRHTVAGIPFSSICLSNACIAPCVAAPLRSQP